MSMTELKVAQERAVKLEKTAWEKTKEWEEAVKLEKAARAVAFAAHDAVMAADDALLLARDVSHALQAALRREAPEKAEAPEVVKEDYIDFGGCRLHPSELWDEEQED